MVKHAMVFTGAAGCGTTPHIAGWVGWRLQTTGWVGQAICVHTVAKVWSGGGQMKQRVAGVGVTIVSHGTGLVGHITAWVQTIGCVTGGQGGACVQIVAGV
jgi:hypothetical protein